MKDEAQLQHEIIGIAGRAGHIPKDFKSNFNHPDAAWYKPAGLGMFIHFGIASVSGCNDLSWGMFKMGDNQMADAVNRYGFAANSTRVPPEYYWSFAERFTVENYNPEKWLSAAAAAGVKYAVLTTRHHDGFALWPSEYGSFNTKNYLNGRDLVGEYIAACRKCGIKVGLYYSPPDWYMDREFMNFSRDPALPILDWHHNPVESIPNPPPEHEQKLSEYRAGQVEELLTRYGKIDLLWFDGYSGIFMTIDKIRELQPGILINDRGHLYGDIQTEGAEGHLPDERPKCAWEGCDVFADGAWGYLDHQTYKPIGWLLSTLTKARAWGGNFLPNVAPDSHGELSETYYLRMKQLKEWMDEYSECIVDIEPGRWPEKSNVPETIRGNTHYLFADWVCDYPIVAELPSAPKKVQCNRKEIPYNYNDGVLTLRVPAELKTNKCDVIEINL